MTASKVHYLIDIHGCGIEVGEAHYWESLVPKLCSMLRLTVRDSVVHRFLPYGATLLFVLAESHLAIHTWPDENFATLEIFSCRHDPDYEAILTNFLDRIPSQYSTVTVILRGQGINGKTLSSFTHYPANADLTSATAFIA